MKLNKKAQAMQEIGGIALGVAVFALIIVIALLIISQVRDTGGDSGYMCVTGSTALGPGLEAYVWNGSNCCNTSVSTCGGANQSFLYTTLGNATGTLQGATQTIPGWVPLIVLIVIGGILLMAVRRFQQ